MNDVQAVITLEEARIFCNFDQVEQAIRETLAEYKGAVFTEDSRVYAKKHVAALRAQKKAFQDRLREEKKKYMDPWAEFEAQAKKLISMYDEPIDLINEQIQVFEEKRIAQKKELVRQIYEETVTGVLASYIPLERIYNTRWENATTKKKEIHREILDIAEKVQKDIFTIRSMGSESEGEALDRYRRNLELSEAVSYINSYERSKQEILDRERERVQQKEKERIRREEREKMVSEQQAELEKAAAVEQAAVEAAQEVIDSLIPDNTEDTNLYEYRIALSASAKEKLEMYMDSVGIEWEAI